MSPAEIDLLVSLGRAGMLDEDEQKLMANELVAYRGMALRLEQAIHSLIKDSEGLV